MKAIINSLLGIPLQVRSNMPGMNKEITQLEATILLPAVCIIFVVVIIASIAISVQKHKH